MFPEPLGVRVRSLLFPDVEMVVPLSERLLVPKPTDVAVAAPMSGVVRTGEVENTTLVVFVPVVPVAADR